MTDEKITRLPQPFKKRDPLRVLERDLDLACGHYDGYVVNEKEAEVTCKGCGTKLNPMWVLQQLCNEESQWHRLFARYQEELGRLQERQRTKCLHCGQMTRISAR